jgi:hypothetical protein
MRSTEGTDAAWLALLPVVRQENRVNNEPEIVLVPSAGEPAFTGEITDRTLDQIIGGTLRPSQGVSKALAIEVRRLRIVSMQSNSFDQKGGRGESPEPLIAGGEALPPLQ